MPTSTFQYIEGSEYVYVSLDNDDIEQAQGVTESTKLAELSRSQAKKFSDLRLNPTQLNNLNLSYLVKFAAENNYLIKDDFVETGRLNIRTYFKHLIKDKLDFIVFQSVSDVGESNNNLAFINDVIKKFKENYTHLNATLLIPLNQSRMGKRHSVLVEVSIQEKKIKEIILHNSQSKWGNLIYLNCLNDLKNALQINNIKCLNYGKQKDDISCGFFVYSYIKSILENEDSNQLESIYVTLKAMLSNPTLLEDTLNENFVKKYPDARKITESGCLLSWEEKALDKELEKEFLQELDAVSLDF